MTEPIWKAVIDRDMAPACLKAHGTSAHPPLPYKDRMRCRCVAVGGDPGYHVPHVNFGCVIELGDEE